MTYTLDKKTSLLALSTLVFFGCAGPQAEFDLELDFPVEIDEVELGDVEKTVVTTGTLRPEVVADINNEVPGHIYIAKDADGKRLVEGSRVQAGDVICEITGEDARLHSGIESAKRNLDNAETELNRRKNLFEQRLISEQLLADQEAQYESALLQYERSMLNADKRTKTTPIGGVILTLARNQADNSPVADGQLVSPGFHIARIAPVDTLIADIELIGPELARVKVGQTARVRHYAFEDKTFSGTITRLSPTMNASNHTFTVEVEIDNSERNLRPNMLVEVAIITEQRIQVPVVPRASVADRAGQDVVFSLDGQRARANYVTLGLGDDERVEIVDGLEMTERIIVRGLETLVNGAQVRVVGD